MPNTATAKQEIWMDRALWYAHRERQLIAKWSSKEFNQNAYNMRRMSMKAYSHLPEHLIRITGDREKVGDIGAAHNKTCECNLCKEVRS